jgi:hypothetical protein
MLKFLSTKSEDFTSEWVETSYKDTVVLISCEDEFYIARVAGDIQEMKTTSLKSLKAAVKERKAFLDNLPEEEIKIEVPKPRKVIDCRPVEKIMLTRSFGLPKPLMDEAKEKLEPDNFFSELVGDEIKHTINHEGHEYCMFGTRPNLERFLSGELSYGFAKLRGQRLVKLYEGTCGSMVALYAEVFISQGEEVRIAKFKESDIMSVRNG